MKRLIQSPLLAWILLAATVLAGSVVLLFTSPSELQLAQTRRQDLRKIQMAMQTQGEVDIVFFGNSLLGATIPSDDTEISREIASRVEQLESNPAAVTVLNLTRPGRALRDIDIYGNHILELKPKLVVIQAEMIVPGSPVVGRRNLTFLERMTDPGYTLPKKISDRFRGWIGLVRTPLLQNDVAPDHSSQRHLALLDSLSSSARIDVMVVDTALDPEEVDLPGRIKKFGTLDYWTDRETNLDFPRHVTLRNFVRRARESGARVLVVEPPISETAAVCAPRGSLKQRSALIVDLLDRNREDFLQYPKPMPDRYFTDYRHANIAGQRAFFPWLALSLARRLNGETKHSGTGDIAHSPGLNQGQTLVD